MTTQKSRFLAEEPLCKGGYTKDQIQRIIGLSDLPNFRRWMNGQTQMLCEGRYWNAEKSGWYPACGGVAHGPVVYTHDLRRYIDLGGINAPILD